MAVTDVSNYLSGNQNIFCFNFNVKLSSSFHNISNVYLSNIVAIHVCLNMAKIYTSYQFYIELMTSVTTQQKLIHNILLDNDRKNNLSEWAYNMKSFMTVQFPTHCILIE